MEATKARHVVGILQGVAAACSVSIFIASIWNLTTKEMIYIYCIIVDMVYTVDIVDMQSHIMTITLLYSM